MNTKHLAVISAAIVLAAGGPAFAGILVDTGDATLGQGLLLDGANKVFGPASLAGEFSLATPSVVTGFSVQIGGLSGAQVTSSIYNATLGAPAASPPLFSTIWDASVVCCGYSYQGPTGLQWTLPAGDYWLSFEALDPDFQGGLQAGPPSPLAAYAYTASYSNGWQVAAPSLTDSFSLKVFGGPAVPEPTTWTLMLLGFGLAGAGLRRRRSSSLAA